MTRFGFLIFNIIYSRIMIYKIYMDIFLYDFIYGLHSFLVEINVDNALIVNCGILRNTSALEVHFILFPYTVSVSVEHLTVFFWHRCKLSVCKILRGIMDCIKVTVNNRKLVLYNGLNEVFLHGLNITQLCTFPLVAVVKAVISVRIGVYTCKPVIISAFFIKLPDRSFFYLFNCHYFTSFCPAGVPL